MHSKRKGRQSIRILKINICTKVQKLPDFLQILRVRKATDGIEDW
jgi:hypothetical protein